MTVTESRLAVLKDILNQFGIERNGDELTLTSDTADFADAKNRFLQAIIKVGDMSMLANPMCRRILQMTFVCSLMRTTYGMWKTFNSVASLVCCARMTLCCRSRVNSRNDSAHLLRGLPSDSFPVPYFHGRIRRRHERHQVNWLLFSSMIRIGALSGVSGNLRRTCTSLLREWCLWLWSGARFLLFAVSTSPQSPTATAPLGEGS